MRRVRTRLSIVAAGALAVGGLLLVAPAADALSAPSGLKLAASPGGAAILAWSPVSGATTYEVQVSTSANFGSIIYDQSTVNHEATPTTALPMQSLWWRVRAAANGRNGAWRAASAPLNRSQPAGPTLASPADGADLAQPSNPALLVWAPIAGATSYTVEVDTSASPDWVGSTSYTTQNTSFVVPSQGPGTYSWRVTAQIGSGQSTLPSSSRSYTIEPLSAMSGVSPADNQAVEEVDFHWNPVPGARGYDLQVSTDSSFNTIIDSKSGIVGTSYAPAKEYDVDQYWWRVRPEDAYGASPDWSDPSIPIRTFQRTWSASVATDPSAPESYQAQSDVPTLIYPANAVSPTVSDPLYYQWSPAHLASRYRIDVGTDPNFSPGTFASCYTTQTTYTPGFSRSPGGDGCWPRSGITYWRVKALDDGPSGSELQGVYSEIHEFVYRPQDVTLVSPGDGAVDVDVPTLTWNASPSTEKYKVTMTWSGGSRSVETYATSYTPSAALPANTVISWYVQSEDVNNHDSLAPVTAVRSFTYRGNAITSNDAALTPTPITSPVDRAPAMSWAPYTGAASYRVWVGPAGTGIFSQLSQTAYYPAFTDISNQFMTTGSYDWWVQALDKSGNVLANGPTSTFTVSDLSPVTGQEVVLNGDSLGSGCTKSIAPDESTTDMSQVCQNMASTPVLHWAPVPDASYYLIYLSNDDHFQNMVYGSLSDSTSLPSTVNTVWTPTAALPDSNAGHPYYWFIRPCKANGICAPDPTRPTNAFGKQSATVSGLAALDNPGATGTQLENDITFTWNDYLATNRSTVNLETNEHPQQAAEEYRLQVSTTASFTTLLEDVKVDSTTYTSPTRLYPEGPLYWRVQAIDGSGNGLAWSDPQSFTKFSPVPTGLTPTTTQSAVQPLRWSPAPFAATYNVEVYKNGDVAASPSNRVLSVSGIRETAYSPTTPLPAGIDYVWRVRRVDVQNGQGAWSAWAHFKVTAPLPTLASPASNALVPSTGALFQWTAPAGDAGKYAAYYTFQRRTSGSTSVAESVTTAEQAWAPTSALTTGSWQWRVIALDSNRQPLSTSSWRSFRVDATPPTVKSYSPIGTIGRTSNITVNFSERVYGVSAKTVQLKLGSRAIQTKLTLNSTATRLTINPTPSLVAGRQYRVILSSGITDVAKNRLSPTAWTITAKR